MDFDHLVCADCLRQVGLVVTLAYGTDRFTVLLVVGVHIDGHGSECSLVARCFANVGHGQLLILFESHAASSTASCILEGVRFLSSIHCKEGHA